MDMEELKERYEATGEERFYEQALELYEQAIAGGSASAHLLTDYGYLRECHGRWAIRAACRCYERAIEADPASDKAHLQLISSLAALRDLDAVLPRYELLVADAPADHRSYRLLGMAHLMAGNHERAAAAIGAGLELAPDDPALVDLQGDLLAATGQADAALASWRRAAALAPDDYGISMRYSAASLLEREGRTAEAAAEWRVIVGWLEERGETIHLDWPRRELMRLEDQLAAG